MPKASKLWPAGKAHVPADRKCRSWTPGFSLPSLLEFCLGALGAAPQAPARRSIIQAVARTSGRLQQPLLLVCIIYTAHFHCQGHLISHGKPGALPSETCALSAYGHAPLFRNLSSYRGTSPGQERWDLGIIGRSPQFQGCPQRQGRQPHGCFVAAAESNLACKI